MMLPIITDQKKQTPSYTPYLLFFLFLVLLLAYLLTMPSDKQPIISPIPDTSLHTPRYEAQGIASYYSRSGCIGCSDTFTMANGEVLDDTKLTIALPVQVVRKHRLLNATVRVVNVDTGAVTHARVTDTGGFAVYRRIADLSVAVKRAIRCTDLCMVEVRAD